VLVLIHSPLLILLILLLGLVFGGLSFFLYPFFFLSYSDTVPTQFGLCFFFFRFSLPLDVISVDWEKGIDRFTYISVDCLLIPFF